MEQKFISISRLQTLKYFNPKFFNIMKFISICMGNKKKKKSSVWKND